MRGIFFVRCTVSGGVTGHRSSLLKRNGVVVEFSSREAARAEANACMAAVSPHSTATFNYTVEADG